MKECNVIAIDLAKNKFQVCILNVKGKVIFNREFTRQKLIDWLPQQIVSLVAMESCGGSSYWARLALSIGHKVMVIPPRQVKPYRTGQKTDSNDALAIAVASKAANIKPARYLNVEQQCLQSIDKLRHMLDKQRLQISNQIRGLLLEFGIVIPKTATALRVRIPEIMEDGENELSGPLRQSLAQMWTLYTQIEENLEQSDSQLKQLAQQDDACKRLMKLEGVGPITAARLKLQLDHKEHFQNGRQASACIGLTPKQHSSGGKVRLGSVSKMSCDHPLRSALFLGSWSVVTKLKNRPAKTQKEQWLKALIQRRGVNCASIALANKTVRTAFAILKHGTDYEPIPIAVS